MQRWHLGRCWQSPGKSPILQVWRWLMSKPVLMFGFGGSIASAKDAKSHLLKPYWQQIWDLASRASVSHVTSRAACILMETLLRFELLDYSEVTETIRSMLSAVDLNGPSVLCDSSLMLWARIMKMRIHTAAGLGLDASKQICNWLRGLWTIGMILSRSLIQQLLTKL